MPLMTSMFVIIRFLSGFIFAFLAHQFLGLSGFLWFLVVILAAGVGIFVVPLLTLAIRDWSAKLARYIAAEVISQLARSPGALLRLTSVPAGFLKRPRTKNKVALKKQKYPNPVILDTSAIIDGRLLDVAKTGFVWATFIVPKFVLLELQTIADSKDDLRRARGRRGLEVLDGLKKIQDISLKVVDTQVSGGDVDEKLLKLGKSLHAKVLTVDYNLNKVGKVRGLEVLNVNELANAVKTVVLPGEELEVRVLEEGKEKGQGVGYLEDGTMIVVEGGEKFVNSSVKVKVSRILQTAAGKMVFCKVKE